MQVKSALLAAALATSLSLGGCATVLTGSNQTITVNSDVPGAQVTLNNFPLGVTPLVVSLRRGHEGLLSVQAPGYMPAQVALNKGFNAIALLNLFTLLGFTTDFITGAIYAYEPSTYFVTLAPAGGMQPAALFERARRETLRAFVLLNNEALVGELAVGRGEYVDALAQLLHVGPEQRGAAVQRWRQSFAVSDTSLAFAERIVAELPQP
jgi:hypothetical protein